MRHVMFVCVVALAGFGVGCARYGPEPETVPMVDVDRYVGKWYEIASNPVFFNRNLVGVTAEYAVLNDTTISVLNTGYRNEIAEENKQTITGTATVVPGTGNAKLKVQFDMFLGFLFRGNYWIVVLDAEEYEYAAVTDNRQMTLFVLGREPAMSRERYDSILAALEAGQVDTTRLRVTGELYE